MGTGDGGVEVSKRHPGKQLLKDGSARARQLEGRTQSRCWRALKLEGKLRGRHWEGRERWG